MSNPKSFAAAKRRTYIPYHATLILIFTRHVLEIVIPNHIVMPFQLFQKLDDNEIKLIEGNIDLLNDLINSRQKDDWVDFFSGGIPINKLEWKGSLQEAYYLFNQIRINTLEGKSLLKIHTKNRGLDWVKINKVISTKYGGIQKESRPSFVKLLSNQLILFLVAVTKVVK